MCGLSISLAIMALTATPVLKDGDVVVFFGDSITVAHTWTRAVEQYVLTHEPDKHVTFINAGVGGHTASDGLARLDVDVLAHKPTVVVVNFGMNDSAYPPKTDGADFAGNMGKILDRLKGAGVRAVLWADTTPYDPGSGAKGGKARTRGERIAELVAHTEVESARRGLTLVRWHQPLQDAVASWEKAKRWEKLIPDKVHPSSPLHAIMATQVLRALGYTPQPTVVDVALNASGEATTVVPTPLVLIGAVKDAVDLGAGDALALRQTILKVKGLEPKKRYRVRVGDTVASADVATATGAELMKGTDILASANEAIRQPAPAGTTMTMAAAPPPPLSSCTPSNDNGHPLLRRHECLWGKLFQKDQLRIAMRHERTRWLPDVFVDQLNTYLAGQTSWVKDVEDDARQTAVALRARPTTITVSEAR